jgi:hypothetical protein
LHNLFFVCYTKRSINFKDNPVKDSLAIHADQGVLVSVGEFDGGVWLAIHRECAYTSAALTKAQALAVRDALNTILEKQNAAQ